MRLVLALVLAGCGSGGSSGADAAPGADAGFVEPRGECPSVDRVGEFLVEEKAADPGIVTGTVRDGVSPVRVLFEEQRSGDCAMYGKMNPFCNPVCDLTSEICSLANMCVPVPRVQQAGTVTVSGLAVPVTLEPRAAGEPTYEKADLPDPPFVEDSPIHLHAAGDAVEAFDLYGYGVAELAVADAEWVIARDQPLMIDWTPSASDKDRIWLRITVDQHGGAAAKTLLCETADTGQLTIDVPLINAFLDSGISGFPNAEILRRTVDRLELSVGCVELVARSHHTQALSVEGHTPCNPGMPCPPPLMCNLMTETCE